MRFVHRIEEEARKAATVRSIDEDKKKIFIEGALFAAGYLRDCISEHVMEPPSVKKFLDELRLRDVREALSIMLAGAEGDEK